jgi:hypothetical protein
VTWFSYVIWSSYAAFFILIKFRSGWWDNGMVFSPTSKFCPPQPQLLTRKWNSSQGMYKYYRSGPL